MACADCLSDRDEEQKSSRDFSVTVVVGEEVHNLWLNPPELHSLDQLIPLKSAYPTNNDDVFEVVIPIAEILDTLHLTPLAHFLEIRFWRHDHSKNKEQKLAAINRFSLIDCRRETVSFQIRDCEIPALGIFTTDHLNRWNSDLIWLNDRAFDVRSTDLDFQRRMEILSQETAAAASYYDLRLTHFRNNSESHCQMLQKLLNEQSQLEDVIESLKMIKHVQWHNYPAWAACDVLYWLKSNVGGLVLSRETKQRMQHITGSRLRDVRDQELLEAGIEDEDTRLRILECISLLLVVNNTYHSDDEDEYDEDEYEEAKMILKRVLISRISKR